MKRKSIKITSHLQTGNLGEEIDVFDKLYVITNILHRYEKF